MIFYGIAIPPDRQMGCLQAIQRLTETPAYSGMQSQPYPSLEDALSDWGFRGEYMYGAFFIERFLMDKWYAERYEPVFMAIAPFVAGGEIAVIGEDWQLWRYVFARAEVQKQWATVQWYDQPSLTNRLHQIIKAASVKLPDEGDVEDFAEGNLPEMAQQINEVRHLLVQAQALLE